jgi:hypothetical protein
MRFVAVLSFLFLPLIYGSHLSIGRCGWPLLIAHAAETRDCDCSLFAGSSSRTSHSSAIKVLAQR